MVNEISPSVSDMAGKGVKEASVKQHTTDGASKWLMGNLPSPPALRYLMSEKIERNKRIIELRDSGLRFREIGIRLHISRQKAYAIYKRDKGKYKNGEANGSTS